LARLSKGEDADTVLGSDIMAACLDGYALLKVTGKGAGLETLRQSMSVRLARGSGAAARPASDQGDQPWTLTRLRLYSSSG
jgi:hypothetical protein